MKYNDVTTVLCGLLSYYASVVYKLLKTNALCTVQPQCNYLHAFMQTKICRHNKIISTYERVTFCGKKAKTKCQNIVFNCMGITKL